MLYQIQDGTVSLKGETVFSHINFEIRGNEKIALVGRNGAGKTTLLRLIAGELTCDRDDKRQGPAVRLYGPVTIGMLRQVNDNRSDRTVEEELLSACPAEDLFDRERFTWEKEYDRLFTGFGFSKEEKKKKLSEFSGGEQTKIALIRLLLEKPDILLLDEPTNHLDMETTVWLEDYLKHYEKAVVMVSHDRFFLDQVAEVTYELTGKSLIRYTGNYTAYRSEKAKALAIQKKRYEEQQEELKRLNDLIERFKNKPKKAAMARSKKKVIERMEKIEAPEEESGYRFTEPRIPEKLGAKWAVTAEHAVIGWKEPLFTLELRMKRGQKIGIIGANGVGKTTLLKTILGTVSLIKGTIELGNDVEIGYFDQLTAGQVSGEATVLSDFAEHNPSMLEKDARMTLARFLFTGRDAMKKLTELSGGERSRFALMKLLTECPNLMILDEPTNHMDIPAKEMLESAFQMYGGSLLFVSHDRYFVKEVADALLVIEDGQVYYYPFGYEHYLSRKDKEKLDASARRSAEEEALIAGLAAVPLPERRFVREKSADAQYTEWKMGIADEKLETERERILGKLPEVDALRCFEDAEYCEKIDREREEAMQALLAEELSWFEILNELEEGESV